MPLLPALRLFALLVLLAITGYQIARRALGLRCSLAIAGMTAFAGTAILMIAANALGYLFPIRTACVGSVVLLTILCLFCGHLPPPPAIDRTPRWLMILLGIFGVLGGWATARFLTSDLWTWGQLPVSSTVMAGNFPIMEPVNPGHTLGYHYGAQFLAAVTSLLTGASLAVSYNIQPFIGLLGALFFTAAVARRMTSSWLAVLLATLLFLGASGLEWLRLIDLASDLHAAWIGHLSAHPFRQLTATFANTFGPSLLMVFGSRTYTLGIPSLVGALLLIEHAWNTKHLPNAVRTGMLAVIFCLSLALTAETALVLLGASAAVTTLLGRWWKGDVAPRRQRMAVVAVSIFGIGAVLSAVQGGVLTEALRGTQVSPGSFEWSDGMLPAYFPGGPYFGPWDWPFLRAVGLPFLLLPVAIVVAWKRRTNMLVVLLAGLMVSHAIIPFVIRYGPRHNEMIRLLYIALACSGFFVGLGIGETWKQLSSNLRTVAVALLGAMLLSSAIYLPTRLLLPTFRFETAPLFAALPVGTAGQQAMYAWVRAHSTLSDHFYTRTLPGDPFAVDPQDRVEDRSEVTNQIRERILFMIHTGRYNVGFLHWGNFTPEQRALEEQFESTCSPETLTAIGAAYLVIDDAARDVWFAQHCTANLWEPWYMPETGSVPRILRISGGDTATIKAVH